MTTREASAVWKASFGSYWTRFIIWLQTAVCVDLEDLVKQRLQSTVHFHFLWRVRMRNTNWVWGAFQVKLSFSYLNLPSILLFTPGLLTGRFLWIAKAFIVFNLRLFLDFLNSSVSKGLKCLYNEKNNAWLLVWWIFKTWFSDTAGDSFSVHDGLVFSTKIGIMTRTQAITVTSMVKVPGGTRNAMTQTSIACTSKANPTGREFIWYHWKTNPESPRWRFAQRTIEVQ